MPTLAESDKDEIRSRILQAARSLIHRRGFAKVSLRDVAQASTFSPAGLYRHFPNWDKILLLIADDYRELLHARLAQVHSPSPDSRLASQSIAYLSFALDRPHDFELIMRKPASESDSLPVPFEPFIDSASRLLPVSTPNHDSCARALAFGVWAIASGFVQQNLHVTHVLTPQLESRCRASVHAFIKGFLEKPFV